MLRVVVVVLVCRGGVCESDLCRRNYIVVCKGGVYEIDLCARNYIGVCESDLCLVRVFFTKVLNKSVFQEC